MQQLLEAINAWNPVDDPLFWPDDRFDELAAQCFRHQYDNVPAYRRLCNGRGVTPADDPHYTEIPAVPTDAFKHVRLFADDAEPTRTFRTSGTTTDARGAHHFRTLDAYRASLHPPFVRFCNPSDTPIRFLTIAPAPHNLPDSSLSFMLGELVEHHGDTHSGFFVTTDTDGTWQLDTDGFAEALDRACSDDTETLVFGTAFAFAEFFVRLDDDWQLPEGSRIVETGGFKGRHRQLSRRDLYDAFTARLGVPESRCLSEYSMTELSSQTYTDEISAADETTGRFRSPPWLAVDIVDPLKLTPLDPGETGLIRFFDLANIDSVSAVLTSDRGVAHPDNSFELLGRAPDSDLRGCSLTIEEIVSDDH